MDRAPRLTPVGPRMGQAVWAERRHVPLTRSDGVLETVCGAAWIRCMCRERHQPRAERRVWFVIGRSCLRVTEAACMGRRRLTWPWMPIQ